MAIGNGTAGRETEAFIRSLNLPGKIPLVMVNESGASVYSASDVARKEFPDLDVSIRGAVSIGRRLMDPLAELVKIDPKSIGVGQYQHDVNQQALKGSLDDVVVSCVNAVGVEVNTASEQLLTYVSGLGPQLARNLLNYRNEQGPFRRRKELTKVPRLGPKAFEQAAGFLRIRGGDELLDVGGRPLLTLLGHRAVGIGEPRDARLRTAGNRLSGPAVQQGGPVGPLGLWRRGVDGRAHHARLVDTGHGVD